MKVESWDTYHVATIKIIHDVVGTSVAEDDQLMICFCCAGILDRQRDSDHLSILSLMNESIVRSNSTFLCMKP